MTRVVNHIASIRRRSAARNAATTSPCTQEVLHRLSAGAERGEAVNARVALDHRRNRVAYRVTRQSGRGLVQSHRPHIGEGASAPDAHKYYIASDRAAFVVGWRIDLIWECLHDIGGPPCSKVDATQRVGIDPRESF